MTKDKALKQALEYVDLVPDDRYNAEHIDREALVADIKEALAQPEQGPVAWMLTDKNINSLQVDSIQRLIDRLKHAHHTDLCVRINGQDEWFQADWLKHMVRVTPPQRPWVGLTDEDRAEIAAQGHQRWKEYAEAIEAKLKEKNTCQE